MIELKQDSLVFSFPEVHEDAVLSVDFQRTLRIPDDAKTYSLPPGLGRFPLKHVDDYSDGVPEKWMEHGGVMFPMYQSEAMWLNFRSSYPFAVKVATGKVNAVTGDDWADGLNRRPQDYLVVPVQPWLDGYVVKKGVIRQFVAMPLGAGYTAEEQLTQKAEHGGLQIMAYPIKAEVYKTRMIKRKSEVMLASSATDMECMACVSEDMGLAPGGQMKQEIYDDENKPEDWDLKRSSRCFVHLANSLIWGEITGENPPTVPPTAKQYTQAGLPWFDYYDDKHAVVKGSKRLKGMKSVAKMGKKKGDKPLPENQPVDPKNVVKLRAGLKKGQVREWED